jgi:hypothetical protein
MGRKADHKISPNAMLRMSAVIIIFPYVCLNTAGNIFLPQANLKLVQVWGFDRLKWTELYVVKNVSYHLFLGFHSRDFYNIVIQN